MDESDYYMRHRDEYDAEEAPYEPLAPELAGVSPLSSWQSAEAKPTRSRGNGPEDDSGMQLREASVIGTAETPQEEQVTPQPEQAVTGYTTPTYWGRENIQEMNEVMGGQPAAQDTFASRGLRALQRYAVGSTWERIQKRFGKGWQGGDE